VRVHALLATALWCLAGAAFSAEAPRDAAPRPSGYHRNEEQTFLTLPEWYIVYSSDEYARSLASAPPSAFPYFRSIGLFWSDYGEVYRATLAYPFNGGYHLMNAVIGVSYSLELALKGVYENTLGRLFEASARSGPSEEDHFAAATAQDYVRFILVRPWYEYPFRRTLSRLWLETHPTGPDLLRKWERKGFLSLEYGVKTVYGRLMGLGTQATYEPETEETFLRVRELPEDLVSGDAKVRVLETEADGTRLLALPRYQPFTSYALAFARRGVHFVDVAGNATILVTVTGDARARPELGAARLLFSSPLPIDPGRERLALAVPVSALGETLSLWERAGWAIEHVYDY
jgi:hypothetical protein